MALVAKDSYCLFGLDWKSAALPLVSGPYHCSPLRCDCN